ANNVNSNWTLGGPKGKPFCTARRCRQGSLYDVTKSGWIDGINFEKCLNVFLPHAKG
ncbi:unnamed protein product, partial [Rotaria magnacalcarata]